MYTHVRTGVRLATRQVIERMILLTLFLVLYICVDTHHADARVLSY